MTEITLRAYIREIDNLIEQEKLDEAIAHCRHLLQRHPKYIECYRLLGKAYLEAKRFGDAADIFQRVLSTVPDDFVSHIGMSIVREDEGNLDSAIWHMERAFETNPANPAIQQELKRLIGRRDGFEPHKVRLTRGALARMYAHGELYPQAIAELQSALDENSDRPDLQVLLARLLWQTDQTTEAAEISGALLEKLPFCLQATRITAAVLQQRGKAEEATAYHRRLAQLDPYMAYTEAPMAEPVRVDADTIMVQKLEWQPGQPLPSTEAAPADWAASLGLEDDEGAGPGTGPLPSWLDDVESPPVPEEEKAPGLQAFEDLPEPEELVVEESQPELSEEVGEDSEDEALDLPPETEQEDKDIPEWMQEAGWQESSGEPEETPVSFSSEELDQLERGEVPAEPSGTVGESGELEPADIPSWLEGMAPGEEEADDTGEEDQELEAILRAEAQPTAEPASADISDEPTDDSLPEEDESTKDVPGWLDEGEPGATSTIMTWLGDRDREEEEPIEHDQVEAGAEREQELEPAAEAPPEEPEEDEAVPSWLSGVAQAAAESDEIEDQELAQLRKQAGQAQTDSEEPEADSIEAGDVPEWLQSITGETEAADELRDADLEQMAEEAEVDLPWEAEVEAAEQDTIPKDDLPPQEIEEAVAPDWLGDFEDEAEETILQEPEPTAAELEAEPEEDWLEGLGAVEDQGEEEIAEEASWLQELSGEPVGDLRGDSGEPTPGWMEGLAEEEDEGTEDEVEARASTWLDDLSDTLAETPAEPVEQTAEEGLDWLDQTEDMEPASEGLPEDHAFEAADEADEDLSWLQDLESGQEAEPTVAGQPTPAAELDEIDEEGVFDWLDQMAAQQGQEDLEREIPEEEKTEREPQVSEEAPPDSFDEGLDWLDRLSETRGIDADIEREPAAGTISGRISGQAPSEATEPEADALEEPTHLGEWEPEGPPEAAEETPAEPTIQPAEVAHPSDEQIEFEAEKSEEEFPDWLRAQGEPEEAKSPAESTEEQTPEGAPDWLREHAETREPSRQPAEPDAEPMEEAPEWLQAAAEPEATTSEPTTAEPVEEVPDWLQEQAEPAEAEPEPTPEPSEQPVATTPPPSPEPEPAESADLESKPPAADEDEEVPDWLRSQVEPSEPQPTGEVEPGPPPEPTEEDQPKITEPEAEAISPEPTVSAPQVEPEATPSEEQPPTPEEISAADVPTPEAEVQPSDEPLVVEEPPKPEEAAEAEELSRARQSLASGDEQQAAEGLQSLIKERKELAGVVELLEAHLENNPDAPLLWQILGDAYMRLDQTDKAVKAYDRGMEESEVFDSARQALAGADYERAAAQYSLLIKNKKRLDVVIEDLEKVVKGEEVDPRIWQILGDAYMKADRIDESIEAYRKGMDSV